MGKQTRRVYGVEDIAYIIILCTKCGVELRYEANSFVSGPYQCPNSRCNAQWSSGAFYRHDATIVEALADFLAIARAKMEDRPDGKKEYVDIALEMRKRGNASEESS